MKTSGESQSKRRDMNAPIPSIQTKRLAFTVWFPPGFLFFLLLATTPVMPGATVEVQVGGGSPAFVPDEVTIQCGDTIDWVFPDPDFPHTVTSGSNGHADGRFGSHIMNSGTFSHTFPDPGSFPYYCSLHWQMGMTGTVTVSPCQASTTRPLNVATRMRVQTGENIMIGGFIVAGNAAKKVIIRAIGPSLAAVGLGDLLADPMLELRSSNGALINSNDNWKDTQRAEIEATGIAPSNDLESCLISILSPGSYTALVSGKNGVTGVGVVEVYDLDQAADSRLANISTRGFVQTGNNVMIGGFILGGGSNSATVIVRAIGPSLAQVGIAGAIPDPTLELRDSNGNLVQSNDNWKDSQQAAIQGTGLAPQNDLESAVVAAVSPGAYTAIVAGKNSQTGVGLVEVYHLQ